jgi:hypothetical protein
MPKDSQGNFHLNTQRANGANRMGGNKAPAPMKAAPQMSHLPEENASEQDGVAGHMKAMHSETGGKHAHIHSDGFSHTTHHVGEDGQVQGPHEHGSAEEAADAMKNFLSEEAQESPSGMAPGHSKDVY